VLENDAVVPPAPTIFVAMSSPQHLGTTQGPKDAQR